MKRSGTDTGSEKLGSCRVPETSQQQKKYEHGE